MNKSYEIRDPIHGFITINEWERDIINHPVFQRLRRIRQLGFTEMVYPGANHTRFEHSLGVMHIATRMFDQITKKEECQPVLKELGFNENGLGNDRALVRLSCLLHDIGHAPFSHASEDLMALINPKDKDSKRYEHEDYSAAIVQHLMHDVIDNHPANGNYRIKAKDIADFISGKTALGRSLLWRNLLSGQLDADRADYLLRDSHHIGVAYGKYDIDRLITTLTISLDEQGTGVIAVESGGEHAAESLIIARYMMFTQVYFHRTRRAYDYHTTEAIKNILSKYEYNDEPNNQNTYPLPVKEEIKKYIEWDDWKIMGYINENRIEKHSKIIKERKHYRFVYETQEVPSQEEAEKAELVETALQNNEEIDDVFVDSAEKYWYKTGNDDIPVLKYSADNSKQIKNLSELSSVVCGLKGVRMIRIYVPLESKEKARKQVSELIKEV